MTMRLPIAILAAVFVGGGCAVENTDTGQVEKQPPPPPEEKSSVATMIDGVTGRTATRQGLKARDKIQQVSKQKNDDLNEVYGQ
jgi:hypothetical protein